MAGPVSWVLPPPFVADVVLKAASNDLKDLCNAKQVCRSWRDACDGDEFNRKLFGECLDATEEDNTGCFLESYKDVSNWFFYGDYYDSGDPGDESYVFEPLPVRTKAGFLTTPNANLLDGVSPQAALVAIRAVLDLGRELMGVGARTGMGNESDSSLYPIVFPWKSGDDLTPQNVVAALGGNPILVNPRGLYVLDLSKPKHRARMAVLFDYDEPMDGQDDASGDDLGGGRVCRQFRKFMFARGAPLIFYAGSMLLNPLPMFYLRMLTDDLVGGFIGSLVHT